jgi:type III restriction enzyme
MMKDIPKVCPEGVLRDIISVLVRELIHKIRKGYESEQDRQKKTAAERWVKAVNYHGGYGKWELLECRDPRTVDKILNGLFTP